MLGDDALYKLLGYDELNTVLDIGSGDGNHADYLRKWGSNVTTIDINGKSDIDCDFNEYIPDEQYDAVWCSHVLEHQPDVNHFLRNIVSIVKPGGLIAITVPPMKHNIVGGHLTVWNEGLLLYNLILAGLDCSDARVGVYGYNISVIVRNKFRDWPELKCDKGDIETLAKYFPVPVEQGFDGRIGDVNW